MVNDSDMFNQWEAGQKYATRVIHEMVDAIEAGKTPTVPAEFLESYSKIIKADLDGSMSKPLIARALSLPSIDEIGQGRSIIDPQAIIKAKKSIMEAIVNEHGKQIEALYVSNNAQSANGEFVNTTEARGQRSLTSKALGILVAGGEIEAFAEVARDHYSRSSNMTDRLAALNAMSEGDNQFFHTSMSDYKARFKDHALATNKWFMIQASRNHPDVLDKVKELRDSEDFDWGNPNRVRALYMGFARMNPVAFHNPDGSGYEFLTDAIIKLNDINQAMASGLAKIMSNWSKYTPELADQMKAQLERVADLPGLNKATKEIVFKSLGRTVSEDTDNQPDSPQNDG